MSWSFPTELPPPRSKARHSSVQPAAEACARVPPPPPLPEESPPIAEEAQALPAGWDSKAMRPVKTKPPHSTRADASDAARAAKLRLREPGTSALGQGCRSFL